MSKCARLLRTSSLILRQQNHKSTWQDSLRTLFTRNKNDMFIVEKNFDRNKESFVKNEEKIKTNNSEEKKLSKFQFYSAIVLTSSVLIGTFYLFKWQIKSLLAKEEASKGEVGDI